MRKLVQFGLIAYTITLIFGMALFGYATTQPELANACSTLVDVTDDRCILVDESGGQCNADGQHPLVIFRRPMLGPDDECFVNGSDAASVTIFDDPQSARYCTEAQLCQCVQVDIGNVGVKEGRWDASCEDNGGGEPTVVSCNETCNGDSRVCENGLTCITGRCRLESNPSSQTCEPAVNEEPDIALTKTLATGQTDEIEIGETGSFTIRVENTGNTSISNPYVTDFYDTQFLSYVNANRATFVINANGSTITGAYPDQNNDGQLDYIFNGITLLPGDTITITMPFVGVASTENQTIIPVGQTRNTARVTAVGLSAEDFADITVIDDGEPQPNIAISKTLSPGYANNFTLGDIVSFTIRIQNTGATVFNTLSFADTFDTSYLEFLSGTVSLNGNTVAIDNTNSTINNGTISITDITTIFGENIDPAEEVQLTLRFESVGVGQTTNTASADSEDTNPVSDSEIAIIEDENTNPNPGVRITKTLTNDTDNDRTYLVGQDVIFQVRIRNTGNTTLENIAFTDTFDTNYLAVDLAQSYLQTSTGTRINNISGLFSVTGATISRTDLTTITGVGDLEPLEFIDIVFFFTAEAPTVPGNTINTAQVVADTLTDEDTEVVIIEDNTNTTIVGCNELCSTTQLCDATENLTCVGVGQGENRCRLATNTSSPTCEPETPNENPELDVEKIIRNDAANDQTFFVGEDVIFTIRIENKGDSTFNIVRLEDQFDQNTLGIDLTRSYIVKSNGIRFNNLTNAVTSATGSIVISDITALGSLGNLAPGEYFDVITYFEALQVTGVPTTNVAIATADGLQDSDNEAVNIISDNEVQVVGCNQICGGQFVCDATQNLACVGVGQGENRCRLVTNVQSTTCEGLVTDTNPQVHIEKTVNGSGQVLVGEEVQFQISITNTGTEDIQNLQFIDSYDASFLNYVSGRAERFNANGIRVSELASIRDYLNINQDGYLEITNVAATPLGVLRPGQRYVFALTFITEIPGQTENLGITAGSDDDGDSTGEQRDAVQIFIENQNTDV